MLLCESRYSAVSLLLIVRVGAIVVVEEIAEVERRIASVNADVDSITGERANVDTALILAGLNAGDAARSCNRE